MNRQAILASPRGFCAGVDRAIKIVELVLEKYGAPVYVRHEIVHNKYVVESLKHKGAIFVEELDEIPAGAHVIFSAHGVAPEVHLTAQRLKLHAIDATCPLVSKVHYEVQKFAKEGYKIIVIGHKNHPEVVGTMGEATDACVLVESVADVQKLPNFNKTAFVTQTTLSVDETKDILIALKSRFPNITSSPKEDICYATTNRQLAVKSVAQKADLVLVIGSKNSSNSQRLVDAAKSCGARAFLIDCAEEINSSWLTGVNTVGISAGASAPEVLVEEVVARLKKLGVSNITEEKFVEENLVFTVPKELNSKI